MQNVDIKDFGKDHWSLLGYIGTLFEYGNAIGKIEPKFFRCNENKHPDFFVSKIAWKPSYGTRLDGYFLPKLEDNKHRVDTERLLPDHDDWDCLDDLRNAGLLTVDGDVFVKLTDKGKEIYSELAKFKSGGGNFSQFSNNEKLKELLKDS